MARKRRTDYPATEKKERERRDMEMMKKETLRRTIREKYCRAVKRGGLWVDPTCYPHMIGK